MKSIDWLKFFDFRPKSVFKLREETQNFGPALKRTLNLRQQKLGQVEFTPIGAVLRLNEAL